MVILPWAHRRDQWRHCRQCSISVWERWRQRHRACCLAVSLPLRPPSACDASSLDAMQPMGMALAAATAAAPTVRRKAPADHRAVVMTSLPALWRQQQQQQEEQQQQQQQQLPTPRRRSQSAASATVAAAAWLLWQRQAWHIMHSCRRRCTRALLHLHRSPCRLRWRSHQQRRSSCICSSSSSKRPRRWVLQLKRHSCCATVVAASGSVSCSTVRSTLPVLPQSTRRHSCSRRATTSSRASCQALRNLPFLLWMHPWLTVSPSRPQAAASSVPGALIIPTCIPPTGQLNIALPQAQGVEDVAMADGSSVAAPAMPLQSAAMYASRNGGEPASAGV